MSAAILIAVGLTGRGAALYVARGASRGFLRFPAVLAWPFSGRQASQQQRFLKPYCSLAAILAWTNRNNLETSYISFIKLLNLNLPSDIASFQELAARLIIRIEALEADNRQLRANVLALEAENRRLEAENKELRARLNANSHNSHNPPSSDGPKKKPAIPRKKGGAKGGKKGHKGDTLKMAAGPDKTVPCRPTVCSCGQTLDGAEGQIVERRQVFDLPEPKLEVTEYQRWVCKCPCCNEEVSGAFPQGVNAPVQYGSGVKAFTTLLSVRCCLSYQKIQCLFKDMFGQPINESTLYSANHKAYTVLEQPEAEIRQQLAGQAVAHFDETGIRVEGSLHWEHTATTELYTYLFIHKSRGQKALRSPDSILPHFLGWAIHDCLRAYFTFEQCRHGTCGSHTVRELAALEEQGSQWAKAFLQYLWMLYGFTRQGQGALPAGLRPWAERRYDELLAMAQAEEPKPEKPPNKRGRPKGTKGYNLFKRLEKYRQAVLAFAYHPEVPFTNNQAERELRPAKAKQKMAGCFRTLHGARMYARIQGFISTVQKHGLNVFKELRAAFDGQPFSFASAGS